MKPQITNSVPRVLRPKSLAEAVRMLAHTAGESRIVAGATALQLEWRRGEPVPRQLIDITTLPELAGITESGEHLRIGAAVRLA